MEDTQDSRIMSVIKLNLSNYSVLYCINAYIDYMRIDYMRCFNCVAYYLMKFLSLSLGSCSDLYLIFCVYVSFGE